MKFVATGRYWLLKPDLIWAGLNRRFILPASQIAVSGYVVKNSSSYFSSTASRDIYFCFSVESVGRSERAAAALPKTSNKSDFSPRLASES